ncbi:hypothetical protein B484DRAFT_449031 [Ochromonadaceae sp. CCMP2298]|nr:hypothetical protein B484DRAFT_449031 [Ochromonadaceae sp. CCMP2298]
MQGVLDALLLPSRKVKAMGNEMPGLNFVELLQASDWVSAPTYAGWLEKKNTGWLMQQIFTKFTWHAKWVALHGLELIYMDEEPTSTNIGAVNVRRMLITSHSRIIAEVEDDPLCFCIQPDKERPVWQFRAENEEVKTNWLIKISQVRAIAVWLDSYEKVKILGVGAQGTVYEMVNRVTGKRFALKEVSIENEKQMQMALTEAKLLKQVTSSVCHPNVMQIEKVFQVVDKFYLVFPLCTGGELYDAVVRRGSFTERKAGLIVHDIVSALHTLHQHNILHMDIKPENVLFETDHPDARIKLTDFGLSKLFSDGGGVAAQSASFPTMEELRSRTEAFIKCGNFNAEHVRGTFGYMSPEVILCGYYSAASDVFAAGVILYILLCGYPPFNSKSLRQLFIRTVNGSYKLSGAQWDELFIRTVNGSYKLSGAQWDAISPDAKDLVRRMLEINPATRIGTKEILDHQWILKAVEYQAEVDRHAEVGAGERVGASGSSEEDVVLPTAGVHLTMGLVGRSSVLPTNNRMLSQLDTTLGRGGGSDGRNRGMSGEVSLALDHLADHIKALKTETLAKNLARLMVAKISHNNSRLSTIFLVHSRKNATKMSSFAEARLAGAGVGAGADAVDDRQMELRQMMDSEWKELAMSALFEYFGAIDGNGLTTEQMGRLLGAMGFTGEWQWIGDGTDDAGSGGAGAVAGLGGVGGSDVGLCEYTSMRFLDRTWSGCTTEADFFLTMMLILQKNELYLRMLFTLYQHSVWYPGRQANHNCAMAHLGLRPPSIHSEKIEVQGNTGTQVNTKQGGLGDHGMIGSEADELCDFKIPNVGNAEKFGGNMGTADKEWEGYEGESPLPDFLPPQGSAPPAAITGKHVGAVFERFGYAAESGQKAFGILCDALVRLRGERAHTPLASSTGPVAARGGSVGAGGGYAGGGAGTAVAGAAEQEMRWEDFLEAVKLDEVLVAVCSQGVHRRVFGLFQRIEEKLNAVQNSPNVTPSNFGKFANLNLIVGLTSAKDAELRQVAVTEVRLYMDALRGI